MTFYAVLRDLVFGLPFACGRRVVGPGKLRERCVRRTPPSGRSPRRRTGPQRRTRTCKGWVPLGKGMVGLVCFKCCC